MTHNCLSMNLRGGRFVICITAKISNVISTMLIVILVAGNLEWIF